MTTKISHSENGSRTHECCGEPMRVDRKREGEYVTLKYVALCRLCGKHYDCNHQTQRAPPHIPSRKPTRIQAVSFEPLPTHGRFIE